MKLPKNSTEFIVPSSLAGTGRNASTGVEAAIDWSNLWNVATTVGPKIWDAGKSVYNWYKNHACQQTCEELVDEQKAACLQNCRNQYS